MVATLLYFAAGLVLLIAGAEALVRGSSRLAAAMGVSPLIIGLTVVAFGTSSPEMAVSVKAAYAGQAGIAMGNVVGSNIFNTLFILGLSAVIAPLAVARQLIRIDVPLMIAVSVLTLLLSADGYISRTDGILLFLALIAYTLFLIVQGRKESAQEQGEYEREFGRDGSAGSLKGLINAGLVLGGLGLLVLGSRWLVFSAVGIAHYAGVSELVIALTIVAAGTSLPEVVTSVIAAIRGEREIAVGNIVGSNLFNLMGVLGLSGIVASSGIAVAPAVVGFDLPIMTAAALACLPIFFSDGRISRWEGAVLFGYYLAYTAFLIMTAQHHAMLPLFNAAMLYFVIPLTSLAILAVALRTLRRRREQSQAESA
ncbi:MAG TPA: calcium/sodium antiporter [Deltaproteobacteria bacterium]|jgi:cation:H+ antiporter|nr:calcium/sodium antiporter [Deltaproteobacteria bacterium]HOI07794.1 calcium/sodium antiporter [Deltaproteobacteria bacterium]